MYLYINRHFETILFIQPDFTPVARMCVNIINKLYKSHLCFGCFYLFHLWILLQCILIHPILLGLKRFSVFLLILFLIGKTSFYSYTLIIKNNRFHSQNRNNTGHWYYLIIINHSIALYILECLKWRKYTYFIIKYTLINMINIYCIIHTYLENSGFSSFQDSFCTKEFSFFRQLYCAYSSTVVNITLHIQECVFSLAFVPSFSSSCCNCITLLANL